MTRPLDGLLVVSLEQAIAAPYCTRLLADQGARIIKVERPDGGDFARAYDEPRAGCRALRLDQPRQGELALDLKDTRGPRGPAPLVARADVFVQNLAPGAAERLGLDADGLLAAYPRLVCCRSPGTARRPGSKKAYDLLVQCEAGLLSVTGTRTRPARRASRWPTSRPAMYAYHRVLAALYSGSATGPGTSLDVSMLEALAEWMGHPMYYSRVRRPGAAARTGARPRLHLPVWTLCRGRRGAVLLGLQNEREWAGLCDTMLGPAGPRADPQVRQQPRPRCPPTTTSRRSLTEASCRSCRPRRR